MLENEKSSIEHARAPKICLRTGIFRAQACLGATLLATSESPTSAFRLKFSVMFLIDVYPLVILSYRIFWALVYQIP